MGEKYLSYSKLTEKRYITRKTRNPFTGRITEDLIGERQYVTYAEIDEMPAADVVEVKHGEWQGGAFCCYDMYGEAVITPITCSECKYEVEEVSNFCPNCGAVMRGTENEY